MKTKNLSLLIFCGLILTTQILSQTPTPTPSPDAENSKARPNTAFVISDKGNEPNNSSTQNQMSVVNGKAINLVKPPYPPDALRARASGAVNVQVTIDENGNVISAVAISGHDLLKGVSEAAARASKFSPTMLEGQKVKITGIIVYNFAPSLGSYSPPKPNPQLENTKWIRFSVFLSLASRNGYSSITDLINIANLLPSDFVSEKELVTKIPLDPVNRAKMVNDIFKLLELKVTTSNWWQIDYGRRLENLNNQVFQVIYRESYKFDENVFYADLTKIKELSENTPQDFPLDFKDLSRKITITFEKNEFTKPENLIIYARNLDRMLRLSINPDSK